MNCKLMSYYLPTTLIFLPDPGTHIADFVSNTIMEN